MIKKIRIKNNLFICSLIIIFISSVALNYLQLRKIENKNEELEKVRFDEVAISKSLKSYSSIIENLETREYVNITKIDNNYGDKNFINIDIEFKGSSLLLESFLDSLKNHENFRRVNFIKLKEKEKEVFSGELSIDFYV